MGVSLRGVHHHCTHRVSAATTTKTALTLTLVFLLLVFVSATIVSPTRKLGYSWLPVRRKAEEEMEKSDGGVVLSRRRRLLGGPGSSPPLCRFKCGLCVPCKAVHVAIHPGVSVPLEYYPEAWRCKCHSKLFKP